MTDLIPAELLEKGAAYIEEHGLWQGAFCQALERGMDAKWWEATQREGAPVCAMGAIIVASNGGDYTAATRALSNHVGQGVPNWNDAAGRTAAEVADAMRACATNLRSASGE